MPNVYYRSISGNSVHHMRLLEEFLDNNHERLSHELHNELCDIYEEMNDEARTAEKEFEDQIEELEDNVKTLERVIEHDRGGIY